MLFQIFLKWQLITKKKWFTENMEKSKANKRKSLTQMLVLSSSESPLHCLPPPPAKQLLPSPLPNRPLFPSPKWTARNLCMSNVNRFGGGRRDCIFFLWIWKFWFLVHKFGSERRQKVDLILAGIKEARERWGDDKGKNGNLLSASGINWNELISCIS
jgi:hypothetical protein